MPEVIELWLNEASVYKNRLVDLPKSLSRGIFDDSSSGSGFRVNHLLQNL